MKLSVYLFLSIGNNYVILDAAEISYQEGSRQLTVISCCIEFQIFLTRAAFLQKNVRLNYFKKVSSNSVAVERLRFVLLSDQSHPIASEILCPCLLVGGCHGVTIPASSSMKKAKNSPRPSRQSSVSWLNTDCLSSLGKNDSDSSGAQVRIYAEPQISNCPSRALPSFHACWSAQGTSVRHAALWKCLVPRSTPPPADLPTSSPASSPQRASPAPGLILQHVPLAVCRCHGHAGQVTLLSPDLCTRKPCPE